MNACIYKGFISSWLELIHLVFLSLRGIARQNLICSEHVVLKTRLYWISQIQITFCAMQTIVLKQNWTNLPRNQCLDIKCTTVESRMQRVKIKLSDFFLPIFTFENMNLQVTSLFVQTNYVMQTMLLLHTTSFIYIDVMSCY